MDKETFLKQSKMLKKQIVDISDIKLKGKTLDLGGGGEGIILQLKNNNTVAIDLSEDELKETPDYGLKIVMDAKDLKFLDNYFETVTAFFSLMYIPKKDHKKVFKEAYRVLKKNGEFHIWDVKMPQKEEGKIGFIVPLEVKIKEKTIETGYGVFWKKEQSIKYYEELAKELGFKVETKEEYNETFYIKLIKE
ncbi:MAG: class I SAM-dependent methyltransferase [Firmicutes bacterium]|nr:class I SAM-dependent methyltransferase [Bacillota bacterium]